MGAKESGQAFLAGALAKLPAELQAQAKAIFESPEATDAIVTIGDGALARGDYSKQMDALRAREQALTERETAATTLYEQNTAWYETHKQALEEYTTLKPAWDAWQADGGKPTGTPTTPTTTTPPTTPPATGKGDDMGLTEEQITKLIAEQVNAAAVDAVGISAWASKRAVEHFQTFGEVLPVDEIVATTIEARSKGHTATLDQTYQSRYGERLKEKQVAAENARIETEVQRRLAEERAKAGPALPFPTRTEASPLDVIGTQTNPADYSVDAAVAHYAQLQQARG